MDATGVVPSTPGLATQSRSYPVMRFIRGLGFRGLGSVSVAASLPARVAADRLQKGLGV